MSRRGGDRRLAAVLFTDIVSSTEIASELGDARWRELLNRHHRIVRTQIKRHGGREQDTAGDGFFATFEVPADAIRCAAAAQREVRALGIEIRAGVNFGEVEMVDGKPGGLVVHAGARIMGASSAGVVTVSSSVKDLLPGAGIAFDDAGMHRLKGLEEEVHLYRVSRIDDEPVQSPETDETTARARRDQIVDPGMGRRRSALLVGGAIGAIVVTAAAVTILSGGDSDPAGGSSPTGPPRQALVALDPATGDEGQVIPIELHALSHSAGLGSSAAAGEAGVWLPRTSNVLHVDPAHREVRTVSLGVSGYLHLATGFGRVWVTEQGLSTINPATDEVRPYIDVVAGTAVGPEGFETGLVTGAGAVWITMSDGRLIRVDPNTRRSRGWQLTDGQVDGAVMGDGAVWAFDTFAGSIIRFDPEANRTDPPIEMSGSVDAVAFAGDRLWVLDRSAGTVTPLGSATSTQVGANPTSIAAGFDALWVGDEDGTVYRIDAITGEAAPAYLGGGEILSVIPDPDLEVVWVDVGSPAD
jgi:class 3 adenylate cyclase/sugar lactone lactonase YvrE